MSNTHNDKRSPSTDALETLGMIHFKPEARDAIHLAVEPVEAATELDVGEKIFISNGKAYPCHEITSTGECIRKYHGIVDPFLPRPVRKGEKFWFIMAPRMVQSLRHVWEHSDFPAGV